MSVIRGTQPRKGEVRKMLVQCCVCKKIRKGKRWVDITSPLSACCHISHGYCPVCAEAAFAELHASLSGVKSASPAA